MNGTVNMRKFYKENMYTLDPLRSQKIHADA